MADNHRTTGKGLKTFFQGTQRVHIDIIGRLVEEQHITLLLQGDSQMQAVALTT